MATVIIGGRELRVRNRADAGGLQRSKALLRAEVALGEARPVDVPDRIAELVLAYVDGNEGVDREWLLNNLPADCGEILRACIIASGGKIENSPGEGSSPQKP